MPKGSEPGNDPQSLAMKRAQVEFHNFASLGDTEHAVPVYAGENRDRAWMLREHAEFIGPLTPFLEIGANAGHTSYMLTNEFGAGGFALDISADALRHGRALKQIWKLEREPVRIAGDAARLPFQTGSLRLVVACQMLSQFLDIDKVFLEVKRVLAPGGTFLFVEEPIRRLLSLRLYRCPYWKQMKWWERKLFEWGLLGYLVKDVIGARQEDSFGIRQNHRMTLNDWDRLVARHFSGRKYEISTADRGWGEHAIHRIARRLDRLNSEWLPSKLLGGSLAAACRKEGEPRPGSAPVTDLGAYLRCPDCEAALRQLTADSLCCETCGYEALREEGVFNVLPSAERRALYPGERPDTVDFSAPSHERHLLEGWYELEGAFGGKFRWMGPAASVWLNRVEAGPQRLRIRGHLHELSFAQEKTVKVELAVNGQTVANRTFDRPGLFVIQSDLIEDGEYRVEIRITPWFTAPPDQRPITANISMIRLVGRD
ncbi:MAG: class I SAM-dependent methyltransferase [Bryobacterales bacterium]|nr:class I SAM-dependent methyltransferase [Bryobacterales bacterium]